MYKRIFLATLVSIFTLSFTQVASAAEMRCSKQKYNKFRVHHNLSYNLVTKPSSVRVYGTIDTPGPETNYEYDIIHKGVSQNGVLVLEFKLIPINEGEPKLTSIGKLKVDKTVWFGNVISAVKLDITGREWGDKSLVCK